MILFKYFSENLKNYMIPVSLYISLPYYFLVLLWSGIYSILFYFKILIGDSLKDKSDDKKVNKFLDHLEIMFDNKYMTSEEYKAKFSSD